MNNRLSAASMEKSHPQRGITRNDVDTLANALWDIAGFNEHEIEIYTQFENGEIDAATAYEALGGEQVLRAVFGAQEAWSRGVGTHRGSI